MPPSKPYLYLRIGGYTLAASVLCLLVLFLISTPLDPLIQGMALLFYVAAIVTMAAVLKQQFKVHLQAATPQSEDKPVCTSEKRESQCHTEEFSIQPAAPSESDLQYPAQPAYLALTRESQTVRALEQCLGGWDRGLSVANSCAEASQQLLNLLQERPNLEEITLLVDTAALEIDPIQLPALIRQDAHRVTLRIIGILDQRQVHPTSQLRDAGYDAFIVKPVEKSQLFAAIHSVQSEITDDANVVDLASYRQRSKRDIRRRILVADKNSSERKRLASLLQHAGHRVKLVENGEQALDALEHQRYDIALINLHLPIMNGTQVIKLHRFTTPHREWTSFIIMTDQTTPATLRTCRELQVSACLFKPVPTDTLLELIQTAPAISPPAVATVEQIPGHSLPRQVTQFLHADLLDTQILQGLEHLDNDNDFVPDLIAIFNRDSSVILQRMEESLEFQNTKHFVELSNVLMDNAGQLGAFALYEACLGLQQMNQEEISDILSVKLSHLRDLVERTTKAFQHYLRERESMHSDLN